MYVRLAIVRCAGLNGVAVGLHDHAQSMPDCALSTVRVFVCEFSLVTYRPVYLHIMHIIHV